MKRLLIRCAVGCVVTREEHQRVHRIPSQEENPWLRYAQPNTPILLHPRDQWPEPHDELIRGAGIVARQQR
ncbi:hypothetical protein M2351_006948 [Azospirillum canadense]|nr:hypothetical protein [Azospirillum canadense]